MFKGKKKKKSLVLADHKWKLKLSNKTSTGSPADQGSDSSQCQRGVLGRSLKGSDGVGNAALPFSNLPAACRRPPLVRKCRACAFFWGASHRLTTVFTLLSFVRSSFFQSSREWKPTLCYTRALWVCACVRVWLLISLVATLLSAPVCVRGSCVPSIIITPVFVFFLSLPPPLLSLRFV